MSFRTPPGSYRQCGFSLIELIVAVAIVGVIAAVAYPTYTESVRKSHRGEAKASLNELAQYMTRVYAENKTYTPGGSAPAVPSGQPNKAYDFTVSAASAETFTLSATPKDAQQNDNCGTLTINHLGQKTAAGADCW